MTTPRQIANQRGDKHYVGKDCRSKHGGIRYTSSGQCVQCNVVQARNFRKSERSKQYQREYQEAYRNDPSKKELLDAIQKRYKSRKRND